MCAWCGHSGCLSCVWILDASVRVYWYQCWCKLSGKQLRYIQNSNLMQYNDTTYHVHGVDLPDANNAYEHWVLVLESISTNVGVN